MKIAVTSENKIIFQHFGHCSEFTVFEVEGDKILSSKALDTSESGHGALAVLLFDEGVEVLICGGIGGGAITALNERNIKIIPGVKGNVEEAVGKYLRGEEIGDPDFVCKHHEGHGEGHDCGEH